MFRVVCFEAEVTNQYILLENNSFILLFVFNLRLVIHSIPRDGSDIDNLAVEKC